MRILFDQATPVPIRPYLEGHTVTTAFRQGWDKLKNGELLAAAEQAGFEVFVTTDQQQWPNVRPHVQRVVDAVNAATPGSFTEVEIPLR
jgi:hypothetical protein